MHITRLTVSRFRNIQNAQLHFSPEVNTIVGDNGSGKTSLLEALYYLGHAKSFRTPHSTQLINLNDNEFVLYGELSNSQTIGIQRGKSTEQIKIAKQLCQKKSELAKTLPIQIINPDVHKILEDSPRYRRRFLDWGVFHVEHSYWDLWRRFQIILKQRNAALKHHWDKKLIDSFSAELAQVVEAITTIKTDYVSALSEEINNLEHNVTGLKLGYQRGWPEAWDYEESLRNSLELDSKTGFTKYGPHRSDLKITLNGTAAKDIVSRGQQKLLACLFKIAQVKLFYSRSGYSPLFLVDDLISELDRQSASQVIRWLVDTHSQLVITSIEPLPLLTVIPGRAIKMFHVEHGGFEEVV